MVKFEKIYDMHYTVSWIVGFLHNIFNNAGCFVITIWNKKIQKKFLLVQV